MTTPKTIRRAAVVLVTFGAIGAVACGSRGPLDDSPFYVDSGAVSEAAAPDAATEAGPPSPFGDAGPIACVACVGTQCQAPIFACLQSRGCVGLLQCVLTTCLGGGGGGGLAGGLDTACLIKCGSTDAAGLPQVIGIAGCLTGSCGAQCGGLLGGGGLGIPGLGGGSSGGRGEPADEGRRSAMLREVFAPWPELGVH